ncbi:MAG: hypothetical protein LC798_03210 [Chloroflexi bacterium]|nr:hypothetical protein [Chloroflexota bacterium]
MTHPPTTALVAEGMANTTAAATAALARDVEAVESVLADLSPGELMVVACGLAGMVGVLGQLLERRGTDVGAWLQRLALETAGWRE